MLFVNIVLVFSSMSLCKILILYSIDATANTIFLHRGRAFSQKPRKPVDKQASGPHTNTLGREIKSPI